MNNEGSNYISKILDEQLFSLNENNQIVQLIDLKNGKEKLNSFRNFEKLLFGSNSTIVLFRGENKEMFYKKCGMYQYIDIYSPNYALYFLIGSKAKSYMTEKNASYQKLKHFKIDDSIEILYENLILYAKHYKLEFLKDSLIDKKSFISKIKNCSNPKIKNFIFYYYFSFIHTMTSNPDKLELYTSLISATYNFETAESFSEQGFVACFWLNEPLIEQAIDTRNLDQYSDIIEKEGLFTIKKDFFKSEEECCVYSAIFPDKILYFYDVSKQIYIINPHLFSTNISTNTLIEGFDIDQSKFFEGIEGIYDSCVMRYRTEIIDEKNI
jgi:hypothetical protein